MPIHFYGRTGLLFLLQRLTSAQQKACQGKIYNRFISHNGRKGTKKFAYIQKFL